MPVAEELKKPWMYCVRKVYELDPLTCPNYQADIRIINPISHPEMIKKAVNTWVYGKEPVRQVIRVQ